MNETDVSIIARYTSAYSSINLRMRDGRHCITASAFLPYCELLHSTYVHQQQPRMRRSVQEFC